MTDLELQFQILDLVPLYVDVYPVYCNQNVYFINETNDEGIIFRFNLNTYHIDKIKHDSLNQKLSGLPMLRKRIAVNDANEIIYLFGEKGAVAQYNVNSNCMTYLISDEWFGIHVQFHGCYIVEYNILFFICSSGCSFYDLNEQKLYTLTYDTGNNNYFYPKGLLYCRKLKRLICVTNYGIFYSEMKDIMNKQNVKWNIYDYQKCITNGWSFVNLFAWCLYCDYYLIFIDSWNRLHCLDLRKIGYGYVSKQSLNDFSNYWKTNNKLHLYDGYAICDDENRIHLFSHTGFLCGSGFDKPVKTSIKHIMLKLIIIEELINGYLRYSFSKNIPMELRNLICKYYNENEFIL